MFVYAVENLHTNTFMSVLGPIHTALTKEPSPHTLYTKFMRDLFFFFFFWNPHFIVGV